MLTIDSWDYMHSVFFNDSWYIDQIKKVTINPDLITSINEVTIDLKNYTYERVKKKRLGFLWEYTALNKVYHYSEWHGYSVKVVDEEPILTQDDRIKDMYYADKQNSQN